MNQTEKSVLDWSEQKWVGNTHFPAGKGRCRLARSETRETNQAAKSIVDWLEQGWAGNEEGSQGCGGRGRGAAVLKD